ncbi:hypothetical protein TWF970_011436 [Orbilia oligospora]|uniref:Uncharacterized protein n=1 Tax=Orbilia oligospora TaxID=2813651 RepID=A0A7C8VII6_ORBOL|nr:hypothetical protein TWF970_011436 [Orbilia oligospora]
MSTLDYTVGWVCALSIERVAAQALLDEVHESPDDFSPNDNNIYVRGIMEKHKVVIAVLPKGEYGIAAASAVARDMLRTFSNIRIGLLVGIGGGAPSEKNDIRLGDIVVGAPSNGESGLFQYDFGKTIQNQEFETTGHLDKAPTILRVALSDIEVEYEMKGHQLKEIISATFDRWPRLRKKYQQPDPSSDRLYQSHICHPPKDERSCMGVCDPSKLIEELTSSNNGLVLGTLSKTGADVKVIKSSLQGKEDLEILNWLTDIDYGPQQSDYRSRRQAGTGQWLLNSPEFQEWVVGDKQSLFCPGIPGAGKTIIASIVVDYLVSKVGNTKVGLAYIYYDMRQTKLQNANHILASLLKQLAETQSSLFPGIKDLYTHHHPRHTRPSFDELSKVLRSIMNTYSKVFLVIDALDESRTSDGFQRLILTEIFYLRNQHNANIFITSRNIPEITEMFKEGKSLEIRARDVDIEKYIKGRISDEGKEPLEELRDRIITQTLGNLPKGLDAYITAYDEAMDRIIHGSKNLAQLAISVLSWITCAKRPLVTSELQHALAIQIEDHDLDVDDLIPIKDIISVCAGLVVVDKESDTIRLVHTTTQEYFERTRQRWFPEAETNIAKACIAYLLFSEFESGMCSSDKVFEARLMKYRFYDYAARNWGHHTTTTSAEEVERLASKFIRNAQKVSAASQAATASRGSHNFSQNVPRQVTGLHLASYFGLWKIVRTLLLEGSEPDVKDTHGRTPLGLAAANGHDAVISLLCASHAVDLNSADKYDNTPLSLAAARGHPAAVEVLLRDDRIDRGRKDIYGNTALAWAEANRHGTVAELLSGPSNNPTAIDTPKDPSLLFRAAKDGNGAAIRMLIEVIPADPKDATGRTPLSWAAMEGQTDVVKILLESENIDVNSKDATGRTPLSWAAMKGQTDAAKVLLESGSVDVNSKDAIGRTPLSWAAINRKAGIVRLLLGSGNVNVNSRDDLGRTPLLWAVINKDIEVARSLLESGNTDVNPRDDLGRTPLLWAVISKDIEVARSLLESGNTDVNSGDDLGQTPLWWAAEEGCEVMLVLLLKHGAKRELRDCCRHTPLWRAISGGHHAIIGLLIEESVTELSQQDASEITLILSAAEQGDADLVKRLLERGIPGGLNDPARRKRTWYAMLTVDVTRNHFREWSWYAMRIIDLACDSHPTDFTLDVYDGNSRATRVKEEDSDNEADNPDGFDYEANSFDDESSGGIVNLLLDCRDRRLLSTAAEKGHEAIIRLLFEEVGPTVPQLLLKKAAFIESNGDRDSRMLLKAAKDGHDGIVRLLVKSKYGRKLLLSACKNGHEGVLRLLLDRGANVNTREFLGRRESLLQHAAEKGCEAVVRLLLEKGANIEPDCPSNRKPVWLAVAGGHEAVARLLIEKGADTRLQRGCTLLAEAIKNELWHILPLLLESNTSAEQKGLKTAVVESTSEGEGLVKLLLEKLGIKKQEIVWRSLLELAANGGHEAKAITHLVLEKDADDTTWYKAEDEATTQLLFETIIYTLVQTVRSNGYGRFKFDVDFLLKAVKDGHETLLEGEPGGKLLFNASNDGCEALVQPLLEKGAHISEASLKMAAWRGHENVVRLLLENGAGINDGDVLEWAVRGGHEGVVRLLLENSACTNDRKSLKSAAIGGYEGVIWLLLENGARTNDGNVLEWVARGGHEGVVRLLLENGARANDGDALEWAAREGHEGVVRLLLLGGGASLEEQDNNKRSSDAIRNGYDGLVLLSSGNGANIESRDLHDKLRLETIVQWRHWGVFQLLFQSLTEDNIAILLKAVKTMPRVTLLRFTRRYGKRLLLAACEYKNPSVVLLLLENGVKIESKGGRGRSLSWVAAQYKNEYIAQALIEKRARTRENSRGSKPPVGVAGSEENLDIALIMLEGAVRVGNEVVVHQVLEGLAADMDQTMFEYIVGSGSVTDAKAFLKAVEGGPNALLKVLFRERFGTTLLQAAAGNGHEAIVQLLLEKGASFDLEADGDYNDKSPLWAAVHNGHEPVVQMLLNHLDSRSYGKTRAESQSWPPQLLEHAVKYGHPNVVRLLLGKVDSRIPEWSRTALLPIAAKYGSVGVAEILIENQADIESGAGDSESPLLEAAQNGYVELVRLLLEKGANVESTSKKTGESPLWAAVRNGYRLTAQLLLEKGANIQFRNEVGYSLLWAAKQSKNRALVWLLLEKGMDSTDPGDDGDEDSEY